MPDPEAVTKSNEGAESLIAVSRDLLRAELGDLELRLTNRLLAEIGNKADLDYVRNLHHRVRTLEAAGALGSHIVQEFSTLRTEVEDVRLHGSREAQDALKDLHEVRGDVEKLKLWRSYLAGAVAVSLFLGAFALDVILRRYV